MNTPTFTWAYTRTFKDKGKKERSVTRLTPVVFPMQWDAVYLNEKRKIGTKNIDRNKKSGKVENETLGKP